MALTTFQSIPKILSAEKKKKKKKSRLDYAVCKHLHTKCMHTPCWHEGIRTVFLLSAAFQPNEMNWEKTKITVVHEKTQHTITETKAMPTHSRCRHFCSPSPPQGYVLWTELHSSSIYSPQDYHIMNDPIHQFM